MKKQIFILGLLLLVASFSLNAATLEEIINGAKQNSTAYQNLVLSRENELLAAQTANDENKVGISVDATISPIEGYGTEEEGITISPSLTITLPGDGGTSISAGSSVTREYISGKTTANGSLGVSHTFTFTSYDAKHANIIEQTSEEYQKKINLKQTELSFEKSVMSTISQLLTLENSMLQSKFDLDKQQEAFDKVKELEVDPTSDVYTTAKESFETYRDAFAAVDGQFSTLLANYRAFTGMEWDGVEIDTIPVLEFSSWDEGNTAVKIQELSYESTYEAYKKAIADANKTSLAVQVSATTDTSKNVGVSGSLTYGGSNWQVSVASQVSINPDEVTPSLTITGHWSNDTASSDSTITTALNNAKIAQNNYIDTLSSYSQEGLSYIQQIIQWDSQKEQKQANLESKKTLLKNEQNLYDLGLSSEEALREAKINYKIAENEWKALLLEGLSLQYDLELFAL